MAQPDTVTRTRSTEGDRRATVETSRAGAPAAGAPDAEISASGPENRQEAGAPPDPDERRNLIEYQAYLLYLERGGAPGLEIDDWLAAERQIDARRK